MGYYAEVGVGRPKDIQTALGWYRLAHEHGNPDATLRLSALSAPSGQSLSRQEHDSITEIKLVRRRTLAAQRSENQPQSPPWDGNSFPTLGQAQATAPPNIRDGRAMLEGIRRSSLVPPMSDPSRSTIQSAAPRTGGSSPPLQQLKRFTLNDTSPSPPPGSNNSSNRTASPGPGRRLRKNNEHNNNSSTNLSSNNPGRFVGVGGAPSSRASRARLNLEDMGPVPPLPGTSGSEPQTVPPGAGAGAGASDDVGGVGGGGATPLPPPTPGTSKYPTTFAEMGFHGVKAEEKECIIM